MLYHTVLLDISVIMVPSFSLTAFLFTIPYCYAVHVGVCLLTFQDSLLVPSGGVKQSKKTASPLKMGLIACCGMMVNNYQHMLCNNPEREDLILCSLCFENVPVSVNWPLCFSRKNMSKNNSKSLSSLRQKLRKYNKEFELDIAKFRENPDQAEDEEDEEKGNGNIL